MASRARVLVASLVVLALGCHLEEPFVRDNPWDEGADRNMVLSGTDSVFSIGDSIVVTLSADPPLPPPPLLIKWSAGTDADTATIVLPAGYGAFVVNRSHAEGQYMPVAAYLDDNIVAHNVWVMQKLGSLDLFCGTATAQVACDATPLLPGVESFVNSTMTDANAFPIRRRQGIMQRATLQSRNAAVALAPKVVNSLGRWSVIGVAAGSTWIVITADGVSDSVRVVVAP